MAGSILSIEQIDAAQRAMQQAMGIADIAGATGQSELPDRALPNAMWAISDLLANGLKALESHPPEAKTE